MQDQPLLPQPDQDQQLLALITAIKAGYPSNHSAIWKQSRIYCAAQTQSSSTDLTLNPNNLPSTMLPSSKEMISRVS